jgi:hypothetical protein
MARFSAETFEQSAAAVIGLLVFWHPRTWPIAGEIAKTITKLAAKLVFSIAFPQQRHLLRIGVRIQNSVNRTFVVRGDSIFASQNEHVFVILMGASIRAPLNRGFGTIFIENTIRSLGGYSSRMIGASGVCWTLSVPLPSSSGKQATTAPIALTRANVPFGFMTGYGRWSLPEAFGKAAVLAKPLSPEELITAVNSIVNLWQRVMRLRD